MAENRIKTSLLIPVIENLLYFFSKFSIYCFIAKRMKWDKSEKIPFWFAEVYIFSWLVMLLLSVILIEKTFFIYFLILPIYRLLDILHGNLFILFVELRTKHDTEGNFILVRDPARWIILTILNILEIFLGFSSFYLYFGSNFITPIITVFQAIFNSVAVFSANGASIPVNGIAKLVVLTNQLYFMMFILIILPVILQSIRVKGDSR